MPVSLCSMTWMPLMRCSGLTAGEFDEFVDFAGVGGDCHFLTVPLVGVDPPDRRCHGVLLLEIELRWVQDGRGSVEPDGPFFRCFVYRLRRGHRSTKCSPRWSESREWLARAPFIGGSSCFWGVVADAKPLREAREAGGIDATGPDVTWGIDRGQQLEIGVFA